MRSKQMVRKIVAAAIALFISVGGVVAAEYKGKVKSVDAEKGTITITINDGDKTLKVAKDAKFTTAKKKQQELLTSQGLKYEGFSKGPQVTLKTEGEGDKE